MTTIPETYKSNNETLDIVGSRCWAGDVLVGVPNIGTDCSAELLLSLSTDACWQQHSSVG